MLLSYFVLDLLEIWCREFNPPGIEDLWCCAFVVVMLWFFLLSNCFGLKSVNSSTLNDIWCNKRVYKKGKSRLSKKKSGESPNLQVNFVSIDLGQTQITRMYQILSKTCWTTCYHSGSCSRCPILFVMGVENISGPSWNPLIEEGPWIL